MSSRQPATITRDNAATLGDFGEFQKQGTTRISLFTVPPGTTYQTPEGLRAEDEATRIAFDVQGGVYPIRESVFQRSYAEAEVREAAPDEPPHDCVAVEAELMLVAEAREPALERLAAILCDGEDIDLEYDFGDFIHGGSLTTARDYAAYIIARLAEQEEQP